MVAIFNLTTSLAIWQPFCLGVNVSIAPHMNWTEWGWMGYWLAKLLHVHEQLGPVLHKYPHDDVIKWKHFPRNWPFVRKIHRSPVNFPHKGQWRGALMFSLIYVWINDWANNREAGDLRRQHGHYDVIVMLIRISIANIRRSYHRLIPTIKMRHVALAAIIGTMIGTLDISKVTATCLEIVNRR